MTGQIKFFEIAFSDISNPNLAYTVTDSAASDTGEVIARNLSNRNLTSGWMTTGSDDTGNTTLICSFGDLQNVTDVFLVDMNFKDYTLEYWSGVAWIIFATITNNTDVTRGHSLDVSTTQIRLIVQSTIIADDQKKMRQLIVTKLLGQFQDWPIISGTEHSLNKQVSEVLSGKAIINESVGAYRFSLEVNGWTNQGDITLLELIFFASKGVLAYVNSGVADNFKFNMLGYRPEDFYVVQPENEYSNDLYKGMYDNRPLVEINFVEVSV